WKQAQVRYRRMLEAGGEHLSTGQRAYLDFVIANCDAMQGRVTEAEKQLRRFLEDADYARTPTWPRAVLIIACSYAEGASRYPLLKLVAERASGHPLGNQALLVLAQDYYALGRWEASKATFEKLQSRSPRPWRAIIARRFLRDLDQKLSSP
ncbi:MAG: hypothetical protein R3336_09005, partial [Phycisphaeraceae bacterium]|nr:hypothetical protein [Phycisphaeraceae bacterium]